LNTVNARIEICSDRGLTEKISEDTVVGEATEIQVLEPVNDEVPEMVTTDQKFEQHQQKLAETVEVINVPEPKRTLLLNLLRDYHDIFALEGDDRLEVNT